MGLRIRATLYLLFGFWWIIGMVISFESEFRGVGLAAKDAVFMYLLGLILMLPGFICIDLGLKKLRWLRTKKTPTQ